MHYFYLVVGNDETRALSTPFLPRVGDTIVIDGRNLTVDKVAWICDGKTLNDAPMISVDHALHAPDETIEDLAMRIARRHYVPAGTGGSNGKIPAIKDLRAETGVGLVEAKELIVAAYKDIEDDLRTLQTATPIRRRFKPGS